MQAAPQPKGEQKIDDGADNVDFQAPEGGRLDLVGQACKIVRADGGYHAGPQHEQDKMAGEGGIDLLEGGHGDDMEENLYPRHADR